MRHSCGFGILYLAKGSTGDTFLLSYLGKEFQPSSSVIREEIQISIQKNCLRVPMQVSPRAQKTLMEKVRGGNSRMLTWHHLNTSSAQPRAQRPLRLIEYQGIFMMLKREVNTEFNKTMLWYQPSDRNGSPIMRGISASSKSTTYVQVSS